MGFRCPKCKKDFGSNKDDFQKHLLECTGNTLNEYEASTLVNSEEQAKQTYVRSLLDCVIKDEQKTAEEIAECIKQGKKDAENELKEQEHDD